MAAHIYVYIYICESEDGIWLQGEAASEAHTFRDGEPNPVIPANAKNNYEIFPKKLRLCNNTNMSATDLCLPSKHYMAMKCCLLLQNLSIWTKKWDGIFFAIYLPLSGCVALPQKGLWKHGAGEAAAVRSHWSHNAMYRLIIAYINTFICPAHCHCDISFRLTIWQSFSIRHD